MLSYTLLSRLTAWRKIHGKSDPRPWLDYYCYSYTVSNDSWGYKNYTERETWCDDAFGRENWFRMFNKFWFTDQEQLLQFKIAWYEKDTESGKLL